MLKRADIPELLDEDLGTASEIESSLRDLRRINQWFGGVSTSEHLLSRVIERSGTRSLSVLDVGGAAGDGPSDVAHRLRKRGVQLHYAVVDRNASHLNGRFPSVAGDALALPFRDRSFDVVSCALLLHHFAPEEIVTFMREALRVSRRAVIVNDLRRSAVHLALVYAGMPLFTSRLTRHDSVASVRRAYTSVEVSQLLKQHFSNRVELSNHYLYRMGLIIWSTQATT